MVYDYINHLKNYGFNWEDDTIRLRYFIKINGTKTQRRLTMKGQIRKMILVDKQKIFNLHFSVKSDLSDANKKIYFDSVPMESNKNNRRRIRFYLFN